VEAEVGAIELSRPHLPDWADLVPHVAVNQFGNRRRSSPLVALASRIGTEADAGLQLLGGTSRLIGCKGGDGPDRQPPLGRAPSATGAVLKYPGLGASRRDAHAEADDLTVEVDGGLSARFDPGDSGLGEPHNWRSRVLQSAAKRFRVATM